MSIQSSSPQWQYDVFLSFRGKDTRKGFTNYLYTALDHQKIKTFRDDPDLEKGEVISPALFAAVKQSRFALIVLSQNYASSTWCLDELVRILECMKARETVLPIFYDVDPSDVRKQTGSFREAFANHEERFRDENEKVQRWRYALTEVASFSGWNSKEWRYESELIRDIVQVIRRKLQATSFSYARNLVGIYSTELQPLNLLLGVGVDDVRFIGIWGMGGIGKTTMVRAVFERISHEFEVSFLLTDVRESVEKRGLLNLQKQLLSGIWTEEANISDLHEGATIIRRLLRHTKVLLILDDVNHSSHLKFLAGNQEWFGSGSRVLITTRYEHLLIEHRVERRLKIKEFNDEDSLQLFSLKAFKGGHPEKDFLELSKSVINYAKGLPLALEVLGSLLRGRDLSGWNSALRKLGRNCNLEIFCILKTSFDDLDDEEKKIFLDIACFFCGEKKDRVSKVLIGCDVSAISGIDALTERSLLTVSYGRLRMHDLLQKMGREIVRRESTNEPGRRSRLWVPEDVKHVLTKNTGTEAIEGIVLNSSEPGVKVDVNAKSFSMMNKLRYLIIKNGNLSNGLECLPNSLQILEWTGYPLKSLPSHFNPEKLLELNMCHSCIKHFLLGIKPLYRLKTIKLSNSLNLVNTPNFQGMPYLELLFLDGCTRLCEVDPGIEVLEKLTLLNLKDCKNLVHFASSVRGLKSLKVLNLSGCSKLKKLPNDMGHLESLEELHVNGSGIRELPSSVGMLERLPLLKMKDCKDLVCLPTSIGGLKSLKVINISGCSKLDKLPEELGHLECLVEVDASGTSIRELPCSMGMLERLVSLSLRDCKHLVCLPSSAGGLKSLKDLNLSGCSKLDKLPNELGFVACMEKLDASGSGIREVPFSIGLLKNLKELSFGGCKEQSRKSWNMMFNSLQFLRKTSCIPAGLLSGLRSVTKLDLSDCNLSEESIPSDFGCLASLRSLNLSKNQFVTLPESIGQLYRLKYLYLDWCCKLRTLPDLPSHVWVNVSNCFSLDTLSNPIGQTNAVLEATCVNCFRLVKNERYKSTALSLLTRYLKIQHCGSSVHFKEARFHFVAPGNEIPEWYNYQRVGSSITVRLHPGWFSDKFMGFALCVVFRLLKPLPPLAEWSINRSLRVNGQFLEPFGILFGGKWGQPVSDHIWFFYVHRDEYYKQVWQDIYYELVFSFKSIHKVEKFGDEIVQVKKCGVRMIYEGDIEELWETLFKQSNTKRGLQHYYDDDDAASSCTGNTKRGLQHYYDDDDAAFSSTGTGASQEEEEEPHPKRFKRLELYGAGPSDQKHG
ncbi:putative toll-like receptor, P-loop containing nucleoside triphosphate hydrolase [Rosa chinensis]|uniref:ADP-ribosyl cyclase/cyclic ADP-ribose hydrolase n=1 Tax=Rosa chinensis TaxID=74649 RepID=A0A2P6PKH9_ROSCH|nr:TMV resistance protein N isoform X1 [Rosa chinensis]PRQ22432.1 putative toll-like receptor, P-loop containing nucleoside triphosphate hydrolase [Rosa chinensis]